jgi:hypothetical protein
MSMTAKLYTISGLSTELNHDRRTVARALARTPADGTAASGDPAWFLTTALRALSRNNGGRERDGYVDDSAINALEDAAARVDDLLDKLRGEADIERRRALFKREGPAIGEFMIALDRCRSGHSAATRMVEEPFVGQMVGAAIGEALALCDLRLEAS